MVVEVLFCLFSVSPCLLFLSCKIKSCSACVKCVSVNCSACIAFVSANDVCSACDRISFDFFRRIRLRFKLTALTFTFYGGECDRKANAYAHYELHGKVTPIEFLGLS